ncbi:hypothetical protein AM1BK_48270 [Neobacillus kokaensis]|uniref:Uncharacterized protein n=1 Tax=Neobacillus kokaensis TaxID=2759023 RepID=A0ABQ3NBJ4_9BACI|nr:hypothetical protein AM1BK_48270 [Neobacillus kokaensis]
MAYKMIMDARNKMACFAVNGSLPWNFDRYLIVMRKNKAVRISKTAKKYGLQRALKPNTFNGTLISPQLMIKNSFFIIPFKIRRHKKENYLKKKIG